MPHLDVIRRTLADHDPTLLEEAPADTFAAVALVLTGDPTDPSFLFIERSHRAGDPWSGHMAFPGGRVEEIDRTLAATAERETMEEVGLDLEGAERIGRLDDQGGRRAGAVRGVRIAAFVYHSPVPGEIVLSDEVQEAMWVPYSHLVDPKRKVEYPYVGHGGPFDGILVGHPERHIVWGLTRRILRSFVELHGEILP